MNTAVWYIYLHCECSWIPDQVGDDVFGARDDVFGARDDVVGRLHLSRNTVIIFDALSLLKRTGPRLALACCVRAYCSENAPNRKATQKFATKL
jgi:hypothetical protein